MERIEIRMPLLNPIIYDGYKKVNDIERRNLIGSYSNTSIFVYSIEGENIPHFHIKIKGERTDVCIKILTNDYFIHGKHKGVLNKSSLKKLVNFFNEKHNNEETNWQYLISVWNKHSQKKISKETHIPNYLEMKQT